MSSPAGRFSDLRGGWLLGPGWAGLRFLLRAVNKQLWGRNYALSDPAVSLIVMFNLHLQIQSLTSAVLKCSLYLFVHCMLFFLKINWLQNSHMLWILASLNYYLHFEMVYRIPDTCLFSPIHRYGLICFWEEFESNSISQTFCSGRVVLFFNFQIFVDGCFLGYSKINYEKWN